MHEAAINQSIIESPRAVPLVKRTHKGEEVIKTFNEEIVRQQTHCDEKREKERKTVDPQTGKEYVWMPEIWRLRGCADVGRGFSLDAAGRAG